MAGSERVREGTVGGRGLAGAPMRAGGVPWGTGFELSSQFYLRRQHRALSGLTGRPWGRKQATEG